MNSEKRVIGGRRLNNKIKNMNHAALAEQFTNDFERTTWHDQTLWFVRQKRDKAVFAVAEFQALRDLASQIKDHTLSRLGDYLIQFEENALKNGVFLLHSPAHPLAAPLVKHE